MLVESGDATRTTLRKQPAQSHSDQKSSKPEWSPYVQTANEGSPSMCSVCIAKKCFNVMLLFIYLRLSEVSVYFLCQFMMSS
jgi:hypothetical protein